MKKILSFLAAGALALGLIGCSGDLHDALITDVSVLQIRGDLPGTTWNDDAKVLEEEDGTYVFKFLATTSIGHFAFTEKGNDWNVAYRVTSDGKLYEGFKTSFDEAVLYNGDSPDCMPVALKVGASYKITVTGGPATVNCKIEQTAEAIPMAIVIDGEESDVTPTGDAKYKYEFEPSAEERTVNFSFKSGISVFAPDAETELTVGNSSSASISSAAAATWSIKLEKDTPYQLAISYADGKVSVTFLTNYSCLLANWLVEGWGRSSFVPDPDKGYPWTESLSGITLSAKTYDETTKIATYEARWVVSNASTIGADIALHKGPNDWTDRYELGDNKELKVGTKYKLEKGTDPGNDRAYVLLGEGNNVIVATYESNDTKGDVYVTYSVEKEVIPPTIPDLSTWNLKGNMNDDSWSTPYFTFTKIKENTFTAVFEWTRDTGTLEFGLIDANGDWKGGCGVELSSAKATADGSVLSGGNSHITGLEKGKTYSITISVKDVDGNASFAFATLK